MFWGRRSISTDRYAFESGYLHQLILLCNKNLDTEAVGMRKWNRRRKDDGITNCEHCVFLTLSDLRDSSCFEHRAWTNRTDHTPVRSYRVYRRVTSFIHCLDFCTVLSYSPSIFRGGTPRQCHYCPLSLTLFVRNGSFQPECELILKFTRKLIMHTLGRLSLARRIFSTA